jgi:type I restriction enzyme M protein
VPSSKRAEQASYDTLWKISNRMRGSVDSGQYKDFVLSLVFLKYVSDAFAERREAIRTELLADDIPAERIDVFLDDKDEYTREGVFWVPDSARWDGLTVQAKSAGTGQLLDNAMDLIMQSNPSLAGVLPKIFNRDHVDQRHLGELVDLLGDARFTGHDGKAGSDVLGEAYEYLLEKFASAEGKRGGEFYTPTSIARLFVEVLAPYKGRVYDPCCGSGGMLVQAKKFALAHGSRRDEIAVYGQEYNQRTWALAKMNLAVHGINGDLSSRWEDTMYADEHPDIKADYILANPPFNMSDWARKTDDPRWRFGIPPAGNANFAWIQHVISKLGPHGSAGIVMANGSMSSKQSGEGHIRAAIVEADLIACMIALPSRLFHTTAIPACVWILEKDKSPQGPRVLADRRSETLFIDARSLGMLTGHGMRVLTTSDLDRIAVTYHAWRGSENSSHPHLPYEDVAGFCRSINLQEIRKQSHVLTPGRYVGRSDVEDTLEDEQVNERISSLTSEFIALLDNASRLESAIRDHARKTVN